MVFGLVDVSMTFSSDIFDHSPYTDTRGHKFKLLKRQTAAGIRANFFTGGIINIWNRLPDMSISIPFQQLVPVLCLNVLLNV